MERQKLKNISTVVKAGLCAQCGTCYAACPQDAISFIVGGVPHFRPHVSDKCTNCGDCLNVCPGRELDYNQLNRSVFGKADHDKLIGTYKHIFIGESADAKIKAASSSGGIVTALLSYCLENRVIDGAVILSAREKKPFDPIPFIGTNREDICRAQKTIYFPVPVNIALRALHSKKASYALVGLPCQIEGYRKYINANPNLPGQVVLTIGLFCGYSPGVEATKFLLEYLGIPISDVAYIKYRDGEWPGRFTVVLNNGEMVPNRSDLAFSDLHQVFMNRRCTLCVNQTNELADISVGDAWKIESKNGHSIFVARTDMGNRIITGAQKSGHLKTVPATETDLIASQSKMLYYKKYGFWYRSMMLRLAGQKTPAVAPIIKHISIWQLIANFILLITLSVMKFKWAVKMFLRKNVGPRLLRNYRYHLGELLAK